MEFDETNSSQGEVFSCDDVGDEILREVMKNITIGQVKPKEEEVEELQASSTLVEVTSKDDSQDEDKSTPSHHHDESSDEEDDASPPFHDAQDEQVVEESI